VRSWCPTLLLLFFACSPLRGQSASDRPALDRFQDSLLAIDDTVALRALGRALARERPPDALRSLRAAFASARLTELGADPSAGAAREQLRRLTRRQPDWPYAWHALALAETRRAAWERADPVALGNRIGTGALERALQYEVRAVAADPTYLPAALTLADLALDLRDTTFYGGALDALRQAEQAQPQPPAALLLALGRVARADDEPEAAVAAFERAVGEGGETMPVARLELARTRLALGRAEGEASYFATAESDDSAIVAGYRADLEPIAADSDLARFDAARGADRAAWLRRFWTDRDHAELRHDGERLREHYRRLLYARRRFALTISRRFYGGRDAYRSGSEELDDRGVIYVRHGEPRTRLRPFVFGLMPNETWRYDRADGDLLFHFSAGYDDAGGGDLYDYRLVESVLDLRGASDAPVDQLLLSRQTLSPLYGRMLNWGPYGAARAKGRERAIGRVSIDYGTTTDSYELQFARRLTATANLIAVGERAGMPLAHFVFGLGPTGTTATEEAAGGVSYPVRVRVVVLDGAEHAVASADTAIVFRLDRPLGSGQYLIGRVELPLPSGGWSWRAAIDQGSEAGVVLPRDTVRAAGPGPALVLSDLALGVEAASATWQPPGAEPVLLTPFDLFPERSELRLYYEAAGAVPGAEYRHEIAVFRMKASPAVPDRRPKVTLSVDERAGGTVIRAYRTLQLRDLKAGSYMIEVRVRGPGGSADVRRRAFQVVKPK
jgi:GWxTD domain-containing protein